MEIELPLSKQNSYNENVTRESTTTRQNALVLSRMTTQCHSWLISRDCDDQEDKDHVTGIACH